MAYWNTSVQTFFLPHDKLDICCVCSANLVCDENNIMSTAENNTHVHCSHHSLHILSDLSDPFLPS